MEAGSEKVNVLLFLFSPANVITVVKIYKLIRMAKRSKQVTITSLFGLGPSKSPKHSENTSADIIDESSEVAECSSHFNCFMMIIISSSRLVEQSRIYSRRTLLNFCIQTLNSL